jgi:hypothetical protein
MFLPSTLSTSSASFHPKQSSDPGPNPANLIRPQHRSGSGLNPTTLIHPQHQSDPSLNATTLIHPQHRSDPGPVLTTLIHPQHRSDTSPRSSTITKPGLAPDPLSIPNHLSPASVPFGINWRMPRTITTSSASSGLNAARQPSSWSTSRRNLSPSTTVPIDINLRKSLPISASQASIGLYAARQPSSRSPPTPLATPVPVGIHLRELQRPINLPIFPVRQPPNPFETSAHCFEVKLTAAEARNNQRLEDRNDLDRQLVGTYPTDISSIFDPPCVTPDDDDFVPPPWLLELISRVASSPGLVPKPPPFLFRTDAAALEHNAALLKQYNYDLSLLLPDFQDTTC